MKHFVFFVSFFLLFSNIEAQHKVIFGLKAIYKLSSEEKNIPLDSAPLGFYQSFFDRDTIHQVPLNRYIQAPDYKVFIGLAVYDDLQGVKNYYLKNEPYFVYDSLKLHSVWYYRFFEKKDTLFVYKILFRTRKTFYPAVINIYSTDSLYIRKIFNNRLWIKQKLK